MDDSVISPVGPIQEGEVVSLADDSTAAQSVLDLTGLINSHLSQIERLKTEAGKYKEMLDDIFQSDPTYQEHDKAVKEATKVRSNTKKQILKTPQAADLAAKVQELRSQIKERNDELSDYLQEYARTTGTSSFETEDGRVKQIVYSARLISIGQ
jgi:uncharacterized coiled-coil DUF342 family protein